MDRMRESVFAILGNINGKSFLDLFSGSGVIALEAVSRGAFPVEAVESDTGKRSCLLSNVSLSEQRILCRFIPVELYIKRAKNHSFDYIFCDPPFPYRFKKELVMDIADSSLMNGGSLLLLHYPRGDFSSVKTLHLFDRREYGRSIVDFLRRAN
jgi:16S rRNA (guanine(966)-N(2))-methyltransferase RsmD